MKKENMEAWGHEDIEKEEDTERVGLRETDGKVL